MATHRIAGSPGSEPEVPPPSAPIVEPPRPGHLSAQPPAQPQQGASQAPIAHLVVDRGVVYVDVGRLRLGRGGALTTGPRTADLTPAIESASIYGGMLLALPHVVSVRAGYKFVDGELTTMPAVVVSVDRKLDDVPPGQAVPMVMPDGTPTDVAVADPVERLAAVDEVVAARIRPTLLIDQIQALGLEAEAALLEAVPIITYQPPQGATLDPITGPMTITCHVSPDAGWPVLRPFLEATHHHLTLGMYDFTAPHIYRTIRSLLKNPKVRWRQTLDPGESLPQPDEVDSTKAEDKPEASINRGLRRVAGNRFETTFAHTGAGKTFASAYHIKVAVRDDEALWLSSGNWQSSNQAPIDLLDPAADRSLIKQYNREWHAVVESPQLAATFQRYLAGDFETAVTTPESALEEVSAFSGPDLLVPVDALLEEEKATGLEVFAPRTFVFDDQNPLTVQPILTPDNYLDLVLPLLRQRPTTRLYFQNQSLNPIKTPTPRWAELVNLLASYSNDASLDVRIIFRKFIDVRKARESLQLAGFNMQRVRHQVGCHTKGIVIDSETVLLGSHNWTNQGVEANRDASLLIRNPGIAGYYERVFLHDWDHLATTRINERAMAIPVLEGTEAAGARGDGDDRYVRVSWADWLED
jgi:hypothetical protein